MNERSWKQPANETQPTGSPLDTSSGGPDVRGYYEEHTARMLRWGPGRGAGAIHRAVWEPGCRTSAESLHTVEKRVVDLLLALAPEHILDLGCGAGSSALWIAERLATRVTGITLSPLQVRLAREGAAERGLEDRCSFLEGDFCSNFAVEGVEAAYAIESFSHASSPAGFFARMEELLPPGAPLLVCDDFLTHDTPSEEMEARWTRRFATGWQLPSLCTVEEATRRAKASGFELSSNEDLSPFLRRTPRAGLLFRRLIESLPLLKASIRSSLAGGTALQVCQRRGWTHYRFLVFRRQNA